MISIVFIYSCGCGSAALSKEELKTELKSRCGTYYKDNQDRKLICEDAVSNFIEKCKDYNSEEAYKFKESTDGIYECINKAGGDDQKEMKCASKIKGMKTCSNFLEAFQDIVKSTKI